MLPGDPPDRCRRRARRASSPSQPDTAAQCPEREASEELVLYIYGAPPRPRVAPTSSTTLRRPLSSRVSQTADELARSRLVNGSTFQPLQRPRRRHARRSAPIAVQPDGQTWRNARSDRLEPPLRCHAIVVRDRGPGLGDVRTSSNPSRESLMWNGRIVCRTGGAAGLAAPTFDHEAAAWGAGARRRSGSTRPGRPGVVRFWIVLTDDATVKRADTSRARSRPSSRRSCPPPGFGAQTSDHGLRKIDAVHTRTPRSASGSAIRPVPMPSSSASPSPASSTRSRRRG